HQDDAPPPSSPPPAADDAHPRHHDDHAHHEQVPTPSLEVSVEERSVVRRVVAAVKDAGGAFGRVKRSHQDHHHAAEYDETLPGSELLPDVCFRRYPSASVSVH